MTRVLSTAERGAFGKLQKAFGIRCTGPEELITALSGGNQQKLLFARALARGGPCIVLMNEPTRGVDVGARADIYRLMRELCDQGFSLIVASSDLEEVAGIADIAVTMYRGAIVGRYERDAIDIGRILADITHPVDAERRDPAFAS